MEEFVKSLRHPSPLPCWLRWLMQLLPTLRWQCKKVLGGRLSLIKPLRFYAPAVCLKFHRQIRLIIADNTEITLLNQIVSAVRKVLRIFGNLMKHEIIIAYDDIVRHWIWQLKFYGK